MKPYAIALVTGVCWTTLHPLPLSATPEEPETKVLAPVGETPESFFQPAEESFFERIPPAGEEGGSSASFWEPVTEDFFENIPRALDPDGNPLSDYDEVLWEKEFGKAESAASEEEWLRDRGYLEYHGTYSTNIDLSAPGRDSDLRVKPNETEVSDWINGFYAGYEHQFGIIPDTLKGILRYDFAHLNYADEPRENATLHRVELATVQRLTETLEWELFGGILVDSREPGAQYFREDFFQWHLGTEFRQELGENASMTAGYQYRHRDYETRRGIDPAGTEQTPYFDWYEHRFWTTYSRNLAENLILDLGLTFSNRNYESDTLSADGAVVPGRFRRYDLWQPLVALTATPGEHTQLTAYYRFDSLLSTGDYYDYDEHRYGLLFEQDLCPRTIPGLRFISQLEFADRNYDSQVANPGRGVRDDERTTLYLALERTLHDTFTTGVDFTYTDNDSNDADSRYQEDRYGVYFRYEF